MAAARAVTAVSCIVPTHDRPDLLREAVRSVLDQALSPRIALEVLVVDDLGAEATARAVEELAASTGHTVQLLHRSTGPAGASASRNAGAAEAQGDLLAFLDDDDVWRPTHLQRMLDAFAARSADMAVTWTDEFDETGAVRPLKRMRAGLTAHDAAVENPGFRGSNFAIRREAFEAMGGFDPQLPVSNDKDFLVRFLQAGLEYVVVPDVTVLYRQHSGPQLTKNTSSRAAGIERYIAKHGDLLSARDISALRRTINVIRYRTATDLRTRAAALVAVAGHTVRSRIGRSVPVNAPLVRATGRGA